VAAIENIKPTTIIGVSTIGGAFTQKVVESMSRINERPLILALLNPTEHAECTAEQAYTWSKGRRSTPLASSFHASTTTVRFILLVAAINLGNAWQQPLLRLVDTVVGIAVGGSCKWIGSYIFYHTVGEPVR
jgi:hypothetical protein